MSGDQGLNDKIEAETKPAVSEDDDDGWGELEDDDDESTN